MYWSNRFSLFSVECMNPSERQISTTVLVIGTGGSGLRAAIELAEAGVDVLALGKRPKSDAPRSARWTPTTPGSSMPPTP
jgi:succinate dehydrogenase / fumarate reductase flavoprotein subunit